MKALKLHQKNLRSITLQATTVLGEIHPGTITIAKIKPHRSGKENLIRIDFDSSGFPGQSFRRFFQFEKIGQCWDIWLTGDLQETANNGAGRADR